MKENPKLSRAEWAYAQILFEQNYDKILAIVCRHLEKLCASSIDVVMQEIYYRVCVNVQKLAAHPSPAAWLAAAAHNVSLEEVNRLLKMKELSDNIEAPQPISLGLEELLPQQTPPNDRDILIRYFERMDSTADIAQDLGLTQDAVRHRLRRAKERLQKNLQKSEK